MEENRLIKQLLDADWAIPDPAWTYSELYNQLQQAKKQLVDLIASMSEIEKATPESDRAVREALDEIGQQLNRTRGMLSE